MQADTMTIASLGGNAVSAITSITVQNTIGIQDFYDLPATAVEGQIEAIVNDVQPQVVKVGMMRSAATVAAVARTLRQYAPRQVVYDPVTVSTHGDVLMSADVASQVKESLLPLCTLVTLRPMDAEYILDCHISTAHDTVAAARRLLGFGCKAVLLQGGRMVDAASTDMLVEQGKPAPHYLSALGVSRQLPGRHGYSGILSTAIATYLCQGHALAESIALAYDYVNNLLASHSGLVGRATELYNEFAKAVAEHHATNRDVHFYAQRLNVSSRYLAQVTKRIAAKSPKAIIDDYLCQQATSLLATTDNTVQEIAYALGFSSQAHFTKFFRKSQGCTPSDFRRQQRHD